MEKLQAALEKARAKRSGDTEALPQKSVGQPRPRLGRKDASWMALQEMHLSDEVLEQHRIVSRKAGAAAAPFDVLRTKLVLQAKQNGWRRLAITSPTPGSGKTTTACNLAMGLGRQKDLRTILMDFDLRAPSIKTFFDAHPAHGVSDVLSGNVSFAEQAMRIGDNVAVSMALEPESDPTRLLLAAETTETLTRIEEAYDPDLMIFDLPSVLVNDDTRAFLKNVDCALIIIRANSTRYDQFDVCEREVAEYTNVIGVVLNAYDNSTAAD